ncbi:MAG: carboxymuconolactone decarboxylase family protein [Bacteroidales bacterium]|nr:carboxymuconolactone decarboxylase family protein [Bacteroidales bacterium]
MKRIIILTLILLSMNTTLNSQSLNERQRNLGVIACLEAQGDLTRLSTALHQALDNGITVNEIKEAFSQLYAYAGFPRSLNALGILSKVIDERKAQGLTVNEGKPWTRPAIWDDARQAESKGTEIQTQLSGRAFNFDFCPQNDHYLKAHLFGDIFAGDQLSAADREIVTVAALSGMKGVEPQLISHKRGAVNMGNSPEAIEELCRYLSEQGLSQVDAAADAQAGSWPQGSANTAFAQYFIGNSYVAPIQAANIEAGEKSVLPFVNVTFEPGCRNNWHIHHGAHQILICVSGRGWYQEWGKAPIALSPGMIIDIPEGAKHWHGAQKDSWFQHVTAHVESEKSSSTEWLEPVTDDVYNKLQ